MERTYVVAMTTQRDIPEGIQSQDRVFTYIVRETMSADAIIEDSCRHFKMPDEYRVVAHLIYPNVPCDVPTRYLVKVTLMPGGYAQAARLRQVGRKFEISDTFTLYDALHELYKENQYETRVGFSISPVNL